VGIGDALDRAILAVIDAEYGGTAQDPDIRQRGEFDVSLSRPGDAGSPFGPVAAVWASATVAFFP